MPAQLLIGVLGGSGGALLRDVLTAQHAGDLPPRRAGTRSPRCRRRRLPRRGTSCQRRDVGGLLVGFALRVAAIRFGLRGPAPRRPHAGTIRSVLRGMNAPPPQPDRPALRRGRRARPDQALHRRPPPAHRRRPGRRHLRRGPAAARRVLRRRAHDVRPAALRARHRVRARRLGAAARDPARRDAPPTARSPRELGSVARAVGRANGRNPISIIVPCHRVIGADGSLTGYAGGLDAKRTLLDHEQGVTSLNHGVPQPR